MQNVNRFFALIFVVLIGLSFDQALYDNISFFSTDDFLITARLFEGFSGGVISGIVTAVVAFLCWFVAKEIDRRGMMTWMRRIAPSIAIVFPMIFFTQMLCTKWTLGPAISNTIVAIVFTFLIHKRRKRRSLYDLK